MVGIVAGLVVGAIVGAAAYNMALVKGRTTAWGILAFFFAPSYFILLALPAVQNAQETKTRNCGACGGLIASTARNCPHCGHSNNDGHRRYNVILQGLAIVILLGACAATAISFLQPGAMASLSAGKAPDGLPLCDSDYGKQLFSSAVDDSPLGKRLGLKVLGLVEDRVTSDDSGHQTCHAVLETNGGEKHYQYQFVRRGGRVFVTGEPEIP